MRYYSIIGLIGANVILLMSCTNHANEVTKKIDKANELIDENNRIMLEDSILIDRAEKRLDGLKESDRSLKLVEKDSLSDEKNNNGIAPVVK